MLVASIVVSFFKEYVDYISLFLKWFGLIPLMICILFLFVISISKEVQKVTVKFIAVSIVVSALTLYYGFNIKEMAVTMSATITDERNLFASVYKIFGVFIGVIQQLISYILLLRVISVYIDRKKKKPIQSVRRFIAKTKQFESIMFLSIVVIFLSILLWGGVTDSKAENSLALGHKAGATVRYGTAIGYESVATEEGTIAFGHDAGDVPGYTVKYPDKEITTHLGYKKTVPDYNKEPTVTPTTYSDAKYNRLVKVADGVDAHDAATVGQLENAISQVQSVGTNIETIINKATASSYALAALQPNFSEGETGLGVAVGFGHYHGKTATALGAYYRPSRNVQFNVGTVVGNGNQGFNGGLSFKVGPESKTAPSSTDARIAQLEKRIQELEQARNN